MICALCLCISSVSASDTGNQTVLEKNSPIDISQDDTTIEKTETGSVERIYESSANEQNSFNNPQDYNSNSKLENLTSIVTANSTFEINSDKLVSGDDILGLNNQNEILKYDHSYDVTPYHSDVVTYLSQFEEVSGGLQGKSGNPNCRIYISPMHAIVGESFHIVVDLESTAKGSGKVWVQLNEQRFDLDSHNKLWYSGDILITEPTNKIIVGGSGISTPTTIEDDGFYVYKDASISLGIDKSQIDLGGSVVLTPKVTDTTDNSQVNVGSVIYYYMDGTKIGESDADGYLVFTPPEKGSYTFYAEFAPETSDVNNLYKPCTSNNVDLNVKDKPDPSFVISSPNSTGGNFHVGDTVYIYNSMSSTTVTMQNYLERTFDSSLGRYKYEEYVLLLNGEDSEIYPETDPNGSLGVYYAYTFTNAGWNNFTGEFYPTRGGNFYYRFGSDPIYSNTLNFYVEETVKQNPTITITVPTVNYGTQSRATINTNVAGQYSLVINNGNSQTINLNNGVNYIDLGLFAAGNSYTANISFAGNTNYNSGSAKTTFSVRKVASTITANDITYNYGNTGSSILSYSGASGVIAKVYNTGGSYVKDAVVKSDSVEVSGLKAGSYTLNITTVPDENHTGVSVIKTITVNPSSSTVSAENVGYVYGNTGSSDLSYSGASGVIAKVYNAGGIYVKDAVVKSDSVEVSGLKAGSYTLNITTVPDENHTATSILKTITVSQATPTFTIVLESLEDDNAVNLHNGIFDLNYTHTLKISIIGLPSDATGNVKFTFDDGSGKEETISINEYFEYTPIKITSSRDTTITATYLGDTNYTTAESTIKYHISRHDVIMDLNSDKTSDIHIGGVINITPIVTVDGNTITNGDKGSIVIEVNGVNKTTIINGDTYKYTVENGGDLKIKAYYLKNDYYRATSKTMETLKVINPTTLTITVSNVSYGKSSVATITTNAPGTYSYNVGGKTGTLTFDEAGSKTVEVELPANDYYDATVNFDGSTDYEQATASTIFKVDKAGSSVSANPINVIYGNPISVNITSVNATGVNYQIVNSAGSIIKSGNLAKGYNITDLKLNAGTYTVKLTTVVDDNFSSYDGETTIKVEKANPELTVTASGSTYPDNVTITVKSLVDGTYTVKINDTTSFTVEVKDGEGNISIRKVAGSYEVSVDLDETINYIASGASDEFEVSNGTIKSSITVGNVVYDGVTAPKAVINVSVAGDYEIIVEGSDIKLDITVLENEVNTNKVVDLGKVLDVKDGYHVVLTSKVPNYDVKTADDTFDVTNGSINILRVVVDSVTYPDAARAVVYANVAGEYVVTVNNKNYTVNVTEEGSGISGYFDILPVDKYDVKVTSKVANYDVKTNKTSFNVIPAGSKVIIDPINNIDYPGNVIVGFNVENRTTVTYVVKTKDGSVVVDNATVVGDSISLTGLGAGDYTIIIVNAKQGNYNGDVAGSEFTVNKVESTVTVPDMVFDYGDSGSVTVVLGGASGIADVKVVEYSGAVVSVNGNSVTVSGLNAGNYTLSVTTVADENHTAVTGTGKVTVNKINPGLTIESTSSTYPDNVTITVKSLVDGTYTVKINDTTQYSVEVKDGEGNISIRKVVGKYNATVSLDETTNYISSSAHDIFEVYKNTTYIYDVDPISAEINHGESITVKGITDAYNATGKVTFINIKTGNVLGTAEINQGLLIGDLHAGVYDINASYEGDKNYGPNWKIIELTVKSVHGGMTVIANPNNYTYGGNTSVRAYVNTTKYHDASGKVEYYIGTTKIGESTINDDGIILNNLTAGSYIIRAEYVSSNGDYEFDNAECRVLVKAANSQVTSNNIEVKYDGNNIHVEFSSKNATNIMYHVYDADNNPVDYGVVGINDNIAVKSLPVGEYIINLTTAVDENHSSITKNYTLKVINGTINVTINADNVIYPNVAKVTVSANVTGKYIITVDGTEFSKEVNLVAGESQIVDLEVLPVNNYTVTITSLVGNYSVATANDNFEVTNGTLNFNVTVVNVNYPDNGTVIVISDVDGDFIVNVGGKNYPVSVVNGTGNATVDRLVPDSYPVVVTPVIPNYDDDSKDGELVISNGAVELSLRVDNIVYPNHVVAVISANVTGKYIVTFDGVNPQEIDIVAGTDYELDLGVMSVGNYTVKVVSDIDYYNAAENSKQVTVSNGTINTLKVVVDSITYPNVAHAVVYASVDGTYIVTVNNKNYTVTVKGGNGTSEDFELLNAGNDYNVKVTSSIENYAVKTIESTFDVYRADPELTIQVTNSTYPNNVTITVKSLVDGTYTVKINDTTSFTVEVKDGEGNISISKIVGTYNATVSLAQSTNYNASSVSKVFEVYKNTTYDYNVKAEPFIIKHGNDTTLYGLIEAFNVTGKVTFTDTETDKVLGTSDINTGCVVSDLHAGLYKINASYEGDENYASKWAIIELEVQQIHDNAMTVIATPNNYTYGGNTTVRAYVNTTKYPDASGKVEYYIGTVKIGESTINDDGIILNNLTPGSYTVRAEYISSNGDYEFDSVTCDILVKAANSDVNSHDINIKYDGKSINMNFSSQNATNITYHVYDADNNSVDYGVVGINDNITIISLPVGDYKINLTTGVDENHTSITKSYNLKINNGTIESSIHVDNIVYDGVTTPNALINVDVAGDYEITVEGTDIKINVYINDDEINTDKIININKILDVKQGYTAILTSKITNYDTKITEDKFNVSNGTIKINVTVDGVNYPDNATVIVNASVGGNYSVIVGNKTYNVTVVNGTGNVTVDVLPVGNHSVEVISKVPNYNETVVKSNLTVNNGTVDFNVTVVNANYPDNGTVIVKSNVDGDFIVKVDGKDYPVSVVDGTGNVTVDRLVPDNYSVVVTPVIPNYGDDSKDDELVISNGTIDLTLHVDNVVYPNHVVAVISANVTGKYTVTVGGVNPQEIDVIAGTDYELDLGVMSVGNYTVKVVSGINYYDVAEDSKQVTVSNGTIQVNVTVNNPTYPDNATVIVNSTVDGNYIVKVDNETYNVAVVNGTGNVTLPVLPAGNYTVNITSNIPNYEKITKDANLTVKNGTIDVKLEIAEVDYPTNVTAVIKTNVTGQYIVTVDGKYSQVIDLINGTPYELDLGILPVGNHTVNVVSNITNYNKAEDSKTATVNNGTIKINVTVNPADYPGNATITVNATVDGDYNVAVGNETYPVHVEDGTGNVTLPVLPVGNYTVKVTGEIPNYSPVNEPADNLIIANGNIKLELCVENITYPANLIVNMTSDVSGDYLVFVDGVNVENITLDANVTKQVDLGQKPVGAYTVIVVSNVANYDIATAKGVVNVTNGTIANLSIEVKDINYTATAHPIALVNASVAGNYTIKVNGTDIEVNFTINDNEINTLVEVDLGKVLDVDLYNATVTSDIDNYAVKTASDLFNVFDGKIDVNVTVKNPTYPKNATITVNATVDGNYNVTVGNETYPVHVENGTGNVTLPVLPVGNYTVKVTGEIPNYSPVNEPADNLIIANGTISLELTVDSVTYPDNVTAIIKTNVTGQYIVTVDGKDSQVVDLINGTPYELDLGILPVGNHTVNVVSNITNYNKAEDTKTVTVNNGTIKVTVEVTGAKYPEPGKVIVNADVDGDYAVNVNGTNYIAHVVNGTGNVTLDVLPAGEYPVKVTAEIPNYNPVDEDGKLTVSNGTIDMNVTVVPADYPNNATVIVNSTVDGNYTVTVDNKTYTVEVINGTGNVTLPVLPAGNYTVNVTSGVPNYDDVTKAEDLTVSNGTISLELTVDSVTYPDNVTAVIKTNVAGQYIVTVDGKDSQVVDLINGTPYELDLGLLPVGNHTVNVVSNIANYNKAEDTKTATVNSGKVKVNVTVVNPTYSDNATVIVNSTVDGNYTVEVGNETYNVTVKNGTGNVTINVLPAGDYNVTVSANITGYDPVNETDDLTVSEGTVDFNVTVDAVVYPDNGTVVIVSDVDGDFIVNVDGKDYPVSVVDGTGNVTVNRLVPGSYPVTVTPVIPNYNNNSKDGVLVVSNGTVRVNVTVINPTYPDNATVIVNSTVDGNYTVEVGNETYNVTVKNGTGNVTLHVLPSGDYNVTVNANITGYNPVDETANLTVSNGTVDYNVTVVNANYPDKCTVIVKSDVDGDFIVNVDGKDYPVSVVNGTGNVTVENLTPGNHTVVVTPNIPNYNNNSKKAELVISDGKANFNITVKNPTYPNNAAVTIDSDVDGDYIVEINNKTYIATVKNGTATIEIDQLDAGDYPVKVISNITNYESVTKEDLLSVNKGKVNLNVSVDDVVSPDSPKVIITSDVDGKYNVTVDNKDYVVDVVDGKAILEVDGLNPGSYDVTVISNDKNYESASAQDSFTIKAPETKPKVTNVKVKITFKTAKGKLLKNQKVTFNYEGKTYTAKTNSKGVATITVKKVGNEVSGIVKVNKIIVDKKVYKHKISKIKYSVKFTNAKGKPIVGKKVTIKFKGKTYKVKTNKKGVASLNLKNLKKGKYTIVAYYQNTYYKTSIQIKN